MANTTNFGWETPDDTDLVKDGAAAIRTLGSSIDTSFVDLKGGTTGQVLAKASNTDLDFTWSAADPLRILDAKGDLISATAADTPARLAVGANDTVLMADSSTATGLKWGTISSGGMTSLATGTLSGTEVSITSISGSYQSLYLVCTGVSISSGNFPFKLRFNGLSLASYSGVGLQVTGAGSGTSTYGNENELDLFFGQNGSQANITTPGFVVEIPYYANTTSRRQFHSYTIYQENAAGNATRLCSGFHFYPSSAAVTSIQIRSVGSFNGGTYTLYGVK